MPRAQPLLQDVDVPGGERGRAAVTDQRAPRSPTPASSRPSRARGCSRDGEDRAAPELALLGADELARRRPARRDRADRQQRAAARSIVHGLSCGMWSWPWSWPWRSRLGVGLDLRVRWRGRRARVAVSRSCQWCSRSSTFSGVAMEGQEHQAPGIEGGQARREDADHEGEIADRRRRRAGDVGRVDDRVLGIEAGEAQPTPGMPRPVMAMVPISITA